MDGRDVTEIEQLISTLTHDLREPLRAISGFGELLEREAEGALSERGMEFLTLLRQSGRRMEDLLDGLSELGRAGTRAVRPAEVDLGAAVGAVVSRREADIRARGARVTHDPLPVVTGDPAGVHALLDRLIDNALKFNDAPEPHVRVEASGRPQGWELTVADDGIGVPERERDRVFDMFRRLHPRDAYPGNGVGLAVCRRIVQRHGGRIWIEDGPAGGTAVRVVIS